MYFCVALSSGKSAEKKMRRFILTMSCISITLAAPISAQDFQKGLEAAQSGDFETALKEWKPLAESGHSSAQNNLGLMYYNGWGVSKDDEEAVQYPTEDVGTPLPESSHMPSPAARSR